MGAAGGTRLDDAEFRRRWSSAHGGADPGTRLVAGYLTAVHRAARPLAEAGTPPDGITVAGLAAALAALVPAAAGGRWALLAAATIVVAALVDGLDGGVALLTGCSTRWGAVLDALADRVADAAFCAVLWLLGAPGPLAAGAAATGWLHEYARARAAAAGMTGVGRVTVSERPTRVVLAAVSCLAAGLYPSVAAVWATAGAAATAVLGAAGFAQLLITVRAALRTPG